jgi:hypothetical protein
VILTVSKDLKSPVHALFTIYYDKLILTNSLGPKRQGVLLTTPIFASFCVCQTDLGDFSLNNPSLNGREQIHPQICGQFSPQAVRKWNSKSP